MDEVRLEMEDGFLGFFWGGGFGRFNWLEGGGRFRSGIIFGFGGSGSFNDDGFWGFRFFGLEEFFGGIFDEIAVGVLKVGSTS